MRVGVARITVLAPFLAIARSDGTDWISPRYLASQAALTPSTAAARKSYISQTTKLSRGGPWTIVHTNITAPTKDPNDYLSWTPYHWPDCNWCSTGGKKSSGKRAEAGGEAGISGTLENLQWHDTENLDMVKRGLMDLTPWFDDQPESRDLNSEDVLEPLLSELIGGSLPTVPPQVNLPSLTSHPSLSIPTDNVPVANKTSTTDRVADPSGVQGVQRTSTKGNVKPTKTHNPSKSSCTPSPAKSMAPSATWTTCPYKARDGHVNPDVRTLKGATAVNDMSQAVLHNAVSFVLTGQSTYASQAAKFLDTFFLEKKTQMHPKVEYGQVTRGPQKQQGTYEGLVDFRGMVKVVNSVLLLRQVKASEWTMAMDHAMSVWAKSYVQWMQTSDLAKRASIAPNNHGTFFAAQLASLQILAGDNRGAIATLKAYYAGIFQNQITRSGEQPMEAVRTRPWHYRCFNVEAMIVNAKLGDYLGMDFWDEKTRYGGTLQSAVDHIIGLNPGKENVLEAVPHVAAIAAAFGDPGNKYLKYIRAKKKNYNQQSFWLYDQSAAFTMSPAATGKSRRSNNFAADQSEPSVEAPRGINSQTPSVDKECPAVFRGQNEIELDPGIFATCALLRPLYPE